MQPARKEPAAAALPYARYWRRVGASWSLASSAMLFRLA
jgi:hypothetical protein